MKNMRQLIIQRKKTFLSDSKKSDFPILDLAPISNLANLGVLTIEGFILQNVSVLDNLDHFGYAYFMGSVLMNESEKTIKDIRFTGDH